MEPKTRYLKTLNFVLLHQAAEGMYFERRFGEAISPVDQVIEAYRDAVDEAADARTARRVAIALWRYAEYAKIVRKHTPKLGHFDDIQKEWNAADAETGLVSD